MAEQRSGKISIWPENRKKSGLDLFLVDNVQWNVLAGAEKGKLEGSTTPNQA